MHNIRVLCFVFCMLGFFSLLSECTGQWKQLPGPLAGTARHLLAHNGFLFAGTDRGVYVSTNNGASWKVATPTMSFLSINTLAADDSTLLEVQTEASFHSASLTFLAGSLPHWSKST